jgi:hypothetical protein
VLVLAGLVTVRSAAGPETTVSQGTIIGKVYDQGSGIPLGGVHVYLGDKLVENNRCGCRGRGGRQSTRSGADGSFLLGGLPADWYRVTAEKLGYTPIVLDSVSVDSTGIAVVKVSLSESPGPKTDVAGTVIHSGCGEPASNIRLYIKDTRLNARTDEFGRFRFDRLPRGVYSISVRDSRHEIENPDSFAILGDVPVELTVRIREIGPADGIDLTAKQGSRCHIHSAPMTRTLIPSLSGSAARIPENVEARIREFPFAQPERTVVHHPAQASKVIEFRCRECVYARNRFSTRGEWIAPDSSSAVDWVRYGIDGFLTFSGPPGLEAIRRDERCSVEGELTADGFEIYYRISLHPEYHRRERRRSFWTTLDIVDGVLIEISDEVTLPGHVKYPAMVNAAIRAVPETRKQISFAVIAQDADSRRDAYRIIRSIELERTKRKPAGDLFQLPPKVSWTR